MFTELLPNRLPMARSTAPMRTAASDATASGSDVARPTSSVPTKVSPKPVASASRSALLANTGAAPRITSDAMAKPIAAVRRLRGSGSGSGAATSSSATARRAVALCR